MKNPLLLILSILSIVLAPDPLQAQSFEAEEVREPVRISVSTTPANAWVMGEGDVVP